MTSKSEPMEVTKNGDVGHTAPTETANESAEDAKPATADL